MKRVLDGNLGELVSRNHPEEELLTLIRDRALAVDPADRYQKAGHFLMDIQRALEPLGGGLSREDLASFIRQVDPVVVERIERRLEGYQAGALSLAEEQENGEASLMLDASMSRAGESRSALKSDRLRLLAAAAGGALSVLVVLGVLGGLWWRHSQSAEEPLSTVQREAVSQPVSPPVLEADVVVPDTKAGVVSPSVEEAGPAVTGEPEASPANRSRAVEGAERERIDSNPAPPPGELLDEAVEQESASFSHSEPDEVLVEEEPAPFAPESLPEVVPNTFVFVSSSESGT